MPTFSGILKESVSDNNNPESVRRRYMVALHEHTHRNVILYASKFTQVDGTIPQNLVSVNDADLQGVMEVIHGLKGNELDLILHLPGGSAEAAEGIMTYLRSKFQNIRVIVPQLAMSAATMMACAADKIMMGKHSFLGPTDPQVPVHTQTGIRFVPGQTIIQQFEEAKADCSNPAKAQAWFPMLAQYGPDLLVRCKMGIKLSQELVAYWLKTHMFSKYADREERSAKIATWFASHEEHKTHARHIPRDRLEKMGLEIEHLEKDQKLQDLVLSIFHATTLSFQFFPIVKIIENHNGNSMLTNVGQPVRPVPSPAVPK